MLKFIIAVMAIATVNVLAQNPKITPIQIKPIDVQKIVAAKNLRRVLTMPDSEKLKKVKELLQTKVEPTKLNSLKLDSPISLNVRNSFVDEKAFLAFDSPSTISAYENSADFSSSGDTFQPKLRIFFNAPTNGFYVFDFAIEKDPGGNPKNQSMRFVSTIWGAVSQPLEVSKQQHQIFILPVNEAGWKVVWLDSENTGWKFLALEIAKVQ